MAFLSINQGLTPNGSLYSRFTLFDHLVKELLPAALTTFRWGFPQEWWVQPYVVPAFVLPSQVITLPGIPIF